jgi:hypothetical protein
MRMLAVMAVGVCGLAAAGCSGQIPLTQELRLRLGDEGVSALQCYVSSDIVLRRSLRSEEGGVTKGHTLRIDRDKRLEEVLIAAKTPGIIVKTDLSRLYVSFEPPIDAKDVVVLFQQGPEGQYFMFPTSMEGENMVVDYGGKAYVATTSSRLAHLVIDEDKYSKTTRETRTVPGRRLGEDPGK